MKRRVLLFSVLGMAALVVVLYVFTRDGSHDKAVHEKRTPVAVQTAPASLEDVGQPFEVGGDVRARETAILTSRIVAEVRQVRVAPGDRVRAGQVLVVLDARDLQAGRARAQAGAVAAEQAAALAAADRQAAEAALALATITHRRISELRQKNSATAAELDEADASLRAAQARLKSAEAQIAQAAAGVDVARAAAEGAVVNQSFASLAAPFDGVVTQKLIEVGNMATPGTPLLTVEDWRSFRLEVRVDQARAAAVAPGRAVEVTLDGDGLAPVTARVVEVSRLVDATAHAFLAKLELPEVAGLRSGMFGRARLMGPTRQALVVPEKAVRRNGQLASVFVVDRTGVARLRLISIGEAAGGRVEVRAGLDEGEVVVVAPPAALVDGSPVTRQAAGGLQ